MILTCPDCAKRYSTNAEAIGPNGRTVRCSSCGTTWFVSAEPDIMELKANESEAVLTSAPEPDLPPEPTIAEITDRLSANEPSEPGAHVHFRDQVDARRRNRRLMGISMIWFVTLGLLATAAILAFLFRQPIVERAPGAASIYNAFGITVKKKGLDFEEPTTRHVVLDGVPNLVVNGHIINRTDETRDVPLIELSIMSKDGESLASWAVQPKDPRIQAGARIEYVSQYPNPPVDADYMKYRFLDEGEVAAQLQAPETLETGNP